MKTYMKKNVIVLVDKDQSDGRYHVRVFTPFTPNQPPFTATGYDFSDVCKFLRNETKDLYNEDQKTTLNGLLHKAIRQLKSSK